MVHTPSKSREHRNQTSSHSHRESGDTKHGLWAELMLCRICEPAVANVIEDPAAELFTNDEAKEQTVPPIVAFNMAVLLAWRSMLVKEAKPSPPNARWRDEARKYLLSVLTEHRNYYDEADEKVRQAKPAAPSCKPTPDELKALKATKIAFQAKKAAIVKRRDAVVKARLTQLAVSFQRATHSHVHVFVDSLARSPLLSFYGSDALREFGWLRSCAVAATPVIRFGPGLPALPGEKALSLVQSHMPIHIEVDVGRLHVVIGSARNHKTANLRLQIRRVKDVVVLTNIVSAHKAQNKTSTYVACVLGAGGML
jgi:hypothetical protein